VDGNLVYSYCHSNCRIPFVRDSCFVTNVPALVKLGILISIRDCFFLCADRQFWDNLLLRRVGHGGECTNRIYSLVSYTVPGWGKWGWQSIQPSVCKESKWKRLQFLKLWKICDGIMLFIKNSVVWIRKWTTPSERPPPVGEVIINFCG
jgi:hypothetical protein